MKHFHLRAFAGDLVEHLPRPLSLKAVSDELLLITLADATRVAVSPNVVVVQGCGEPFYGNTAPVRALRALQKRSAKPTP